MLEIVFSPTSRRDLVEILDWSRKQFGSGAQRRYRQLIKQAVRELASNPDRLGARSVPELDANVRLYHLRHSRQNVAAERVNRPRHFLLYRVTETAKLEIGRILHDSMDLERHYPSGF